MVSSIKTSPQFNHCGFHGLVPYLVAFINPKVVATPDLTFKEVSPSKQDRKTFLKSKGVDYFLQAFANYYQLESKNNLHKKLNRLLTKYPHPLDLQVLLGPVLRLTLKDILLEDTHHKAALKKIFQALIDNCIENYPRRTKNVSQWLLQLKLSPQSQNDALLISNIQIIGRLINHPGSSLSRETWNSAYKNYCEYLGSMTKCPNVNFEHLTLLANSFGINLQIQPLADQPQPESLPIKHAVAQVKLIPQANQWQIATKKTSQWDYLKNTPTCSAIFKNYHDISCEPLFNLVDQNALAILQASFIKKIKRFLTKKIAFKEQFYSVLPSCNANHSGLEGLSDLIGEVVTNDELLVLKKSPEQFKQTTGFKSFLKAFRTYYDLSQKLSDRKTIQRLRDLFSEYLHFNDRLAILSPVLRLVANQNPLSEKQITPDELRSLCQQFKVNLEIYLHNGSQKVSCFEKIQSAAPKKDIFYTLTAAINQKGWWRVEKNEAKTLIAHATTLYAPHQTFKAFAKKKLAAQTQRRELQNRIIKNLKMGIFDANADKNDKFIQCAYDRACRLKQSKLLYPFLKYKKLNHSEQAVLTAIADKDLWLLHALQKRNAPIVTSKKLSRLLTLSLNAAIKQADDAPFSEALQKLLLIYHHQFSAKNQVTFSQDISPLIKKALTKHSPNWINQLIAYYENLPAMLKQKKLAPIVSQNIHQIITVIAQHAIKAIQRDHAKQLTECLIADKRCLLINGEDNPLHAALKVKRYDWVRSIYVNELVNECGGVKNTLTPKEINLIKHNAKKIFDSFPSQVVDRFDRTLSFRLQRSQLKEKISAQIDHSPTWRAVIKSQANRLGFKAAQARIYCADRLFEKYNHTARIKQNKIYSYGQVVVYGISNLATLATHGPVRYGLNLAWSLTPNVLRGAVLTPLAKGAGLAASYVGVNPKTVEQTAPFLLEQGISLLIFPHYYIASSVLGAGVYYCFKDTGHDNFEAVFQLASDSVAHMLTSNKQEEVNARYHYQLAKNLTPFIGEWGTSLVAPVIAQVNSMANSVHDVVNLPLQYVTPYFSPYTLENLPGLSHFNELYHMKRVFEERAFHAIESLTLGFMQDSPFKNDRLHAIQSFETSILYAEHIKLSKKLAAVSSNVEQQNISLQAAFEENEALLKSAIEKEEILFKQTEGYSHYQNWQDKYVALVSGRRNATLSAVKLQTLAEEENEALHQAQYYNSDLTMASGKHWAESIEELFVKHQNNLFDKTNLPGTIENIVRGTLDIYTDRNLMATFCANEIIRYQYPFYPDVGDKNVIEQERKQLQQEIVNDKLSGYKHNVSRVEDRLYDYIFAKITNTPIKRHVHRIEKIIKPTINEILGKTIGLIPFKDFKGGRSQLGNMGLQWNSTMGLRNAAVDFLINNIPVHRVYDATIQSPMGAELKTKQFTNLATQPMSAPHEKVTATQKSAAKPTPAVLANPAMAIDNPYIEDIMQDQFNELFGDKKKKKQQRIKSKASHKKVNKVSKVVPVKPANPPPIYTITTKERQPAKNDDAVSLKEIKEYAIQAGFETIDEAVEAIESILSYRGNDLVKGLSPEQALIEKATRVFRTFIGEEAKRLSLKEQTATSKVILRFIEKYDKMTKHEKAKALTKFVVSNLIGLAAGGVVGKVVKGLPAVGKEKIPVKTVESKALKTPSVKETLNTELAVATKVDKAANAATFTPSYDLRTKLIKNKQSGGKNYSNIYELPKDADFFVQENAAIQIYKKIRKNNLDISVIAKNTGISEYQICRIKNHLFENNHQLRLTNGRFDPDYDTALSWTRLQNGTFTPQDMQLLRHEYFESRFEGIFQTDYDTAHIAANRSGRFSGQNEKEASKYTLDSRKKNRLVFEGDNNGLSHLLRKNK